MNPVRKIPCRTITETVKRLFTEANTELGKDVLSAVRRARRDETSERARHTLRQIEENAQIARKEKAALCQDTGLAVIFAEVGQDARVVDGDFSEAVQEGVRRAYGEGFFRKSICDPLTRKNTGDNTPAVIHTEIVPGDRIRITVMPKGGGSENSSSLHMLLPTAGIEGIRKAVVETVERAGPNPCPPVIVGVGIGGSMDRASTLAKKALLRPLGEKQQDRRLAKIERELLKDINKLGIGPQGYGGKTTALAVQVLMEPCHIASLPVAVNIQCHAARSKFAVI
jgi:fumarate hydratase subunit alpha